LAHDAEGLTLHALELELVVNCLALRAVWDAHLLLVCLRHFTLGLFKRLFLDLRKLTLDTSDLLLN
jgi:hypothetical protein